MRANKKRFIVTNIIIATAWSFFLWCIFGNTIHPAFYLIPFYAVQVVRSAKSRMEELAERQMMTLELLADVIQKYDPEFNLREYFSDDEDDFDND